MADKNHCAALMRLAPVWSTLIFAVAAAGVSDSQSAWRKLDSIEGGHLAAGSRVHFTPPEVNAWIRDEAALNVPRGARNVRIQLGESRATGYADIDFLKLRQAATGEEPGWIMRNLFSGERPVAVTARFESRNGRARVDVERVEISGIPIEGHTLEFLIDTYVRATFPDVKISEWFALRDRVDRFDVNQRGLSVVIGK